MSGFDAYESSIKKQTKMMLIGFGVIVFLLVVTVMILTFRLTNYAFGASEVFDHEALPVHVCKEGMKMISNKSAKDFLVEKSLIKSLEKLEYPDFKELIADEDIILLKIVSGKERDEDGFMYQVCRLVFRTSDADVGMRAFEVKISESDDFEFQRKVRDYSEALVSKKEKERL